MNDKLTDRYDSQDLTSFTSQLFQKAGLDEEKASISAAILVEGDLMGHSTHGLGLLSPYLAEAEAGRMLGEGQPDVVASTATTQTWDGRYLPGPWLTVKAAEWASAQAKEAGMAAVSIRRSSHIGCLASYLYRVASQGQMLILGCSDPSTASVAPFGGTQRLYTPNPLAAGWPSPGGPVMLDVSMSITTNGMTKRKHVEGSQFSTPVLMDASGAPSADPATFFSNPPGTLLPLGGIEAGHKGFALGLLIEALTSALGGHGRADGADQWGASVFVLVLDPARFGGSGAFLREAGWMADSVHANPPLPGGSAPRLPGERGLALRAEQLAHGIALHPSIPPVLADRAARAGLAAPQPLRGKGSS